MPWQSCVRCDRRAHCDDDGICGHCQRALTAEAYAGLAVMGLYLKRQAEFAVWLHDHGKDR